MIDCEALATRIDRECYRQGITACEMLRASGLKTRTLTNIRMAKRGPTLDTAIKICRVLGKDLNWLAGLEDRT